MIVLGFNILGNLNKNATSIENLGLPLWRVVIAGGILSAIMGGFNVIAVSRSRSVFESFTNTATELRLWRLQGTHHRTPHSQ